MDMFLFPGQGSQELGMGKLFYDSSEAVRSLYAQAAKISGLDMAELCFEGPLENLTQTGNLQPAMTTTVLACLNAVEEMGLKPDLVAGHSLGEYAALAAAGVISKADCLRLVSERGRLMQREAEANPGAMTAVMLMDPAVVEGLVDELSADFEICLANYNSVKQLVVSGSVAAIDALEALISENKGRFKRLPVSGAWHSPLMKNAERELADVIESVSFSDARIPVMLNVTGEAASDGTEIKETMKRQMCSGVRWYPAIGNAFNQGVRRFAEIGPKSVLTGMLKYIVNKKEITTHKVSNPEALAQLKEAMG